MVQITPVNVKNTSLLSRIVILDQQTLALKSKTRIKIKM